MSSYLTSYHPSIEPVHQVTNLLFPKSRLRFWDRSSKACISSDKYIRLKFPSPDGASTRSIAITQDPISRAWTAGWWSDFKAIKSLLSDKTHCEIADGMSAERRNKDFGAPEAVITFPIGVRGEEVMAAFGLQTCDESQAVEDASQTVSWDDVKIFRQNKGGETDDQEGKYRVTATKRGRGWKPEHSTAPYSFCFAPPGDRTQRTVVEVWPNRGQ